MLKRFCLVNEFVGKLENQYARTIFDLVFCLFCSLDFIIARKSRWLKFRCSKRMRKSQQQR